MAQLDGYGLTTQGASEYNFKINEKFANVSKSKFSYSMTNNLTADVGQIIPISCFWTLPNSDYNITVKEQVRCINVPQVPIMSRLTMYTHYFYAPMTSLWKYWELFFTKGHMNDVTLKIPTYHYKHSLDLIENGTYEDIREGSLADYLNQPYAITGDNGNKKVEAQISLLKVMMYLKCYRAFFLNEELHKSSKAWYPDEEGRFRLNQSTWEELDDEALIVEKSKYTEDRDADFDQKEANGDPWWNLGIMQLRYRDYGTDYFTAARITPMRGPVPNLPIQNKINEDNYLDVVLQDSVNSERTGNLFMKPEGMGANLPEQPFHMIGQGGGEDNPILIKGGYYADRKGIETHHIITGDLSTNQLNIKTLMAKGSIAGTYELTIDKLKALEVAQWELVKRARTDYTYGNIMSTFFGERPRSANDYRPEFIGGCKQPIIFSEVLQTSQSSEDNPLGKMGGHAYGEQQNGVIGHIHSDDYGIILGVISIVPETLYHGGRLREDCYSVQDELYLPERAGLAPQPIFNQEICYTGDDEYDNGVWGFTNIYDNFRMRQNQVHGLFALNPTDEKGKSWSPYTFCRRFRDSQGNIVKPNLNQNFATTKNFSKLGSFAVESEPLFGIEVMEDVQAVLPMPYDGEPQGL